MKNVAIPDYCGATKPKAKEPEPPAAFSCERCGAARRTHMLETTEGELVSFVRLCDKCLKHEYTRHVKRGYKP